MSRKSRTGFTLIELLVVIAIIAILAAILFPVFAKARDKARQAACLSNLKQMGLGVMMYKDDYDNTYPPVVNAQPTEFPGGTGWIATLPSGYAWAWQQLIYPYTKNYQMFYCPNSPLRYSAQYGHQTAWYLYGANANVLGYCPEYPGGQGMIDALGAGIKSEAAIPSPATIYMLMDAGGYTLGWWDVLSGYDGHYLPGSGKLTNGGYWVAWSGSTSSPYYSDFMNGRHNGGANVNFADGHAKWIKVEEMLQGAKNHLAGTGTDPWVPKD